METAHSLRLKVLKGGGQGSKWAEIAFYCRMELMYLLINSNIVFSCTCFVWVLSGFLESAFGLSQTRSWCLATQSPSLCASSRSFWEQPAQWEMTRQAGCGGGGGWGRLRTNARRRHTPKVWVTRLTKVRAEWLSTLLPLELSVSPLEMCPVCVNIITFSLAA